MPQWGYYEVMVGAIFTATPLTLMALALPLLRRLETHGMRPWLMSCLAVAAVLVVFDSHVGGLGWRYSADFGWLISLASIPGLLWLVNGREPSRSLAGANDAACRRWHRPRHSVALADALGRDAGRIVGAGHSHTKLLRAVAQRFDDRQQSDALASGSVLVHPAIGPGRSATRQASVFSQHSGRCFPRPAA